MANLSKVETLALLIILENVGESKQTVGAMRDLHKTSEKSEHHDVQYESGCSPNLLGTQHPLGGDGTSYNVQNTM